MKLKRAQVSLISKIIVFIVALVGTILGFVLSKAPWYLRPVMYTVLSNMVITACYFLLVVLALIKYDDSKRWVCVTRFTCTCVVFLTFIVFALFLTPISLITGKNNPWDHVSLMMHFVTPPLVLLDYLIIDRSFSKMNKHLVWVATSVPIIYLATMLIRGGLSNAPHDITGSASARYPYFFMDPYFVGIFFEGGNPECGYNIHFGVVPFTITLISLYVGMAFLIYYFKIKIQNRYQQKSTNLLINKTK